MTVTKEAFFFQFLKNLGVNARIKKRRNQLLTKTANALYRFDPARKIIMATLTSKVYTNSDGYVDQNEVLKYIIKSRNGKIEVSLEDKVVQIFQSKDDVLLIEK